MSRAETPVRVAVATLGCKTNQYDSAGLLGRLDPAVFVAVDYSAQADVYIVNSCTVTQLAERQSRQFAYQAKRRNPDATVIMAGCYATMDPDGLRENDALDVVVAREDEQSVLDVLMALARKLGHEPQPVDHGPQFGSKTRPFLKVQDGCEAVCTYCIIPSVRGPVQSSPIADVIGRMERLYEQGVKEVVLTGIHVGQWGRDLEGHPGFDRLLAAIAEWGKIPRVRISSLEPLELTDTLIGIVEQSDVICPHLHIPLQSGCDEILEAMRRPYRTRHFKARIEAAAARIPDLGLGMDVIIGFPGEDAARFKATCAFIESLPYSYLHVFPYSERPGTPAAAMPAHVPIPTRKARARELIELGQARGRAFAEAHLGRTVEVLVEQTRDKQGRWHGFSQNYMDVRLSTDDVAIAPETILPVLLEARLPASATLLGRPLTSGDWPGDPATERD